MSTPIIDLIAIEQAISVERLTRYRAAATGDLAAAIALYERNIALSESVYGLLHGLEVALRNQMHTVLSAHFGGPRWFSSPTTLLNAYSRDKVTEAIRNAGANATPGKIVAELSYGFWCALAAHRYHWTLWQPCLHKAFPGVRLARHLIHGRLESIRQLRNRIAHHERILTGAETLYAGAGPTVSLAELAACAAWLNPHVHTWLTTNFRYATAQQILQQSKGIAL